MSGYFINMDAFWELTEKQLDTHFVGQWEVTQTDAYNTPKAGVSVRTAVVRSFVDEEANSVTLLAHLADMFGTDPVVMDGSVGVYSKVTERMLGFSDTLTRTNTLVVKHVRCDELQERLVVNKHKEGTYVLKTECALDDVVFNLCGEYTFPFVYHLCGERKSAPQLTGFTCEMPLSVFNHYVYMRDLWHREYKGAHRILPKDLQ